MQGVISALADKVSADPDSAARALAWLVVLCATVISWSLYRLLARKPDRQVFTEEPENGHVELPTPEQTALLIRKRRSVFTKDLSGEEVPRSTVEHMLEAANWAPTHGKSEPWRFVVLGSEPLQQFISVMIEALNDIPVLEQRDQKAAKLTSKRYKMGGVVWAIAICFKRQAGEKLMPEWEELAATAAAVQNLHLMATSLSVAGYWTSWGPSEARDSPRVKQWLGLKDEGDRCIGVFLLGKSDKLDSYRAKRGPISDKVTWRL